MAESREEGRKEGLEVGLDLFIKYLMSKDPSLFYEDAKNLVED